MLSRRELIGLGMGAFAFGKCGALSAFCGETPPRLRLGVMSDIHLTWNVDEPGSYERIEKVLRFYRDRNVDGVVIAGDIADWGFVDQLVQFAELWRKVFPDDRAPDGHRVERLFVGGNHDLCGPYEPYKWEGRSIFEQKERFVKTVGIGVAWEKAFGEKYESIWLKEVKGFSFTGAHWGCEKGLSEFLAAHRAKINPNLPYFHIQHPHPLGTVYPGTFSKNSWNYDHGAAKKVLAEFPNAVALSGHTHLSLTDERSIWQGEFTSVATASLSYVWHAPGRENSVPPNKRTAQMPKINPWPWKDPDRGHQLMCFDVYDDRIEIERLSAFDFMRLGPNWVVPTDAAKRPYEFKSRQASLPPPEFPVGASVTVSKPFAGKDRAGKETQQVDVRFPTASAGRSRAFEYEVAAEVESEGGWKTHLQKQVFSPTYHKSVAAEAKEANCVFATAELPQAGACRFVVTPLSSMGTRGKSIVSDAGAFRCAQGVKFQKVSG